MFLNRRRHLRQPVSPGVYVDLGPDNSGWLSNISEGGMELRLFRPGAIGEVVRLEFGLPGTRNRIEVTCRIAWRDKFGRKTGVQFLDLSEASHQQIREWRPFRVTQVGGAMPKSTSHRLRMFVILILLAVILVVLYPFMQKWFPPRLRSVPPAETTASRKVKVWTVKQTGLYYCPDSKMYGKGESGVLMPQEKAVEGGYRPAGGETCR